MFFLSNLYVFAYAVEVTFHLNTNAAGDALWKKVFKVFFLAQGLVSPAIRLQESAFRNAISTTITKIFTNPCGAQDTSSTENTEMTPLFLFLASSLNVELVYVILKGITNFSYIKTDTKNMRITQKIKRLEFSEQDGDLTLRMHEIKIKDFEKWQLMKNDEDLELVNKDHGMDL